MTIRARFEDGVFRPLGQVTIAEGTVVEVHVPVESTQARPRSVGNLSFAGLWSDREDLVDSVGFINRLRRELRE